MTDRELLDLAAKAAGLDVVMTQPFIGLQIRSGNLWNSLTDDGDALRLATDMDMVISINRIDGYTEASCGYSNADLVSLKVKHEKDMYAATRRAIVRAAASIGKDMQ